MTAGKRILAALDDHQPADEAERESLDRTRSYIEDAEAPMDREDRFGHVVASGIVASPSLDRVVLLHHRQLDMWLQPGGHAEAGETEPRAVAEREAREETGLAVRAHAAFEGLVDVDAHRIPATDAMPEHWHFDLRYAFAADTSEQPTVPADEGHEARWFGVDEALEELELDGGLQRLLRKLADRRT